jgi:ADP-L-glycero-D-manno-heptose 6-epimerase
MIIVTGGAGFIGSNIVNALCTRATADVVICDRLRKGDKWRNIAKSEVADIVAPEQLFEYLSDHGNAVEAIIHMGAISATTERDADLIIDTNFRFSLALWNWCTERGAQFIYASSAATYGDGTRGFDDDGSVDGLGPLRPLNPYGWSKHLFDRRIARLVARKDPTPRRWTGLKFFNVYGPNEGHKGPMKSVVAQIYPDVAAGNPVRLFRSHRNDCKDGEQRRDFVYVDDCVDVVLWLLDQATVNGLFNLGTGAARTFLDLAHAVYRAVECAPNIDFVDTPVGIRDRYQYFTEAPMDRLRAAGYDNPFTSLEDGVANYIGNYLGTDDPFR